MPVYVYRCPNEHEWEVVEDYNENRRRPCKFCAEEAKRVIGRVEVRFVGGGFYSTDNKGEKE